MGSGHDSSNCLLEEVVGDDLRFSLPSLSNDTKLMVLAVEISSVVTGLTVDLDRKENQDLHNERFVVVVVVVVVVGGRVDSGYDPAKFIFLPDPEKGRVGFSLLLSFLSAIDPLTRLYPDTIVCDRLLPSAPESEIVYVKLRRYMYE